MPWSVCLRLTSALEGKNSHFKNTCQALHMLSENAAFLLYCYVPRVVPSLVSTLVTKPLEAASVHGGGAGVYIIPVRRKGHMCTVTVAEKQLPDSVSSFPLFSLLRILPFLKH